MRDRYADAVGWIEQALRLPGADADPALRVRVLCFEVWALWPLGRGAEQAAAIAEAEAIARALGDPLVLSRVLETWSSCEGSHGGSRERMEELADEALALARAAHDDRAVSMATFARAMAAADAAALEERVGQAAALLEAVGNVEARLRTTLFEPARADHGADAWDAAVREGAALSFDDAVAYALDEPDAHAVA